MESPMVVSYGMGVDSTAMLVEMVKRAIRPDLILFADTGGEKPETYGYLPIIDAFLRQHGFPGVTVVRYEPVKATYRTLEEKCLTNQTLPSLAYGQHSCALVFKVDPQNKYVKNWEPAQLAWRCGMKVIRVIGYDCSASDLKRRKKADALRLKGPSGFREENLYENWYPLQDWGFDRVQCMDAIESMGLPMPVKSACFFCPASKKAEILALRSSHPELYHRALAIEANALGGRHDHRSVKGLGRRFSWAQVDTAPDSAAGLMRP